jgi:hypothetical protein
MGKVESMACCSPSPTVCVEYSLCERYGHTDPTGGLWWTVRGGGVTELGGAGPSLPVCARAEYSLWAPTAIQTQPVVCGGGRRERWSA